MDRCADAGRGTSASLLTAQQLEELQRQAYDEAFAEGEQAGYAAGVAQARAQAEQFAALAHGLARPFEELDDCVEQELATLAIAIAKQLIRRELRTERGQVIAVVREALAMLPVGTRDVCVHMHPNDARLVRELLVPPGEQPSWRLVEDPTLSRGGCHVSSESSQIDARLETRIGAIVSSVLGGERSAD